MEEKKYYCPICGAELSLDEDNREKYFSDSETLVLEIPLYCDECEDERGVVVETYHLSLINEKVKIN